MGAGQNRIISLAAGVVQEFPPERVVHAAAEAGYGAAGIWFDPESWNAARTRAVRDALETTGISALDIEVAWLDPADAPDAHDRIVEVAAEIGARHVLVVSGEPEIDDTVRRLVRLCERAEGAGTRISLEFFGMTQIRSLEQALDVVRRVDHPAAAILIDALHLERTGGAPSDLVGLDPAYFPYVQLCDANAHLEGEGARALMREALKGRLLPGEGALPLVELLAVLAPSTPLSIELRSAALIEEHPDDPVARATVVFEATRRFLEAMDGA